MTECALAEAPALLRNEPPFGPLRLRTLHVDCPPLRGDWFGVHQQAEPAEDAPDAALQALLAALQAHASLRSLRLDDARLGSDALCHALVDAALALPLHSLTLHQGRLSSDALVRLLGGGALRELRLRYCGDALGAPAALAAALADNATLTTLELEAARLPAALLRALVGHRSLRALECAGDRGLNPDEAAVASEALGALVAADAPALRELNIHQLRLGDDALRPLLEALPRSSRLRTLSLALERTAGDDFAAAVLLPVVRANASLRLLRTYEHPAMPSLSEAVRLVGARA
jgi:hypothetical protein